MAISPDNSITASPPSLLGDMFQLFDIAEAAAAAEAREWGEEAGLNLFLEDTIDLVRQELETMPQICGKRTGERARLFVITKNLLDIEPLREHYEEVARYADVWIFGAHRGMFKPMPGVRIVTIPAGSLLACERSVIVDSSCFGAALFVREAGQLETINNVSSNYFEGFLTVREDAVETASRRLGTLLQIPMATTRRIDHNLVTSWYSRLNTRFLESLEGQKLALRAHARELENSLDEQRRQAELLRSYVGTKTWNEVQETMATGSAMVKDRRDELTICFCDLVGFTPLSERLHPAEVAKILNDHFARLSNIVRTHGGWIDKFIGDAMLAVFPEPADALAASEKMVRESRKVRVNEAMEIPVAVRVGLNSGLVAVANLGTLDHRQYTVLGDAVNLAQRLQSTTDPHTVLLSEDTYTRLPLSMQRNLQPFNVQLKGKTGIARAYLWTLQSHKAVSERSELREKLLNSGRRSPLAERLRPPGERGS